MQVFFGDKMSAMQRQAAGERVELIVAVKDASSVSFGDHADELLAVQVRHGGGTVCK